MSTPQKISLDLSRAVVLIEEVKLQKLIESEEIAIKFFERFVSNCKAAILLLEVGMVNEAYAIHRLSLENFFNFSALLEKPEFFKEITKYSLSQVHKILKLIKSDEDRLKQQHLTRENKELLKAKLEEYEKNPILSSGYSIFNAAQCSEELAGLYNTHYRKISLFYAHSTFASICSDKIYSKQDLLVYVDDFLNISISLLKKKFLV